MVKYRKPKKSERDKIASNSKMLTNLLLWEATGGTIPLPKGAEGYKVPNIAFPERRALLDSISRLMLTDLKVDPDEEVSGFDLLRREYGDRGKDSDRGISPAAETGSSVISDDSEPDDSTEES